MRPTERFELVIWDKVDGQDRPVSLGGCRSYQHATPLVNQAFSEGKIQNPQRILLVPKKNVFPCEPLDLKSLRTVVETVPQAAVENEPAAKSPVVARFLVDLRARMAIQDQMLDYYLEWYNPPKMVSVVPRKQPDITYLVDLEDNDGNMSCTCDSFIFRNDPKNIGDLLQPFMPCRHLTLVKLVLQHNLLPF